jgi:hypothetical protein
VSDRSALGPWRRIRRSRARALPIAGALLGAALAGCAQPGTQVPKADAAKLGVGTADVSTACGYLEELTAFGARKGKRLTPIESMAQTGARKLAAVYAHDQTDIYQGDSIGAVLGDSISLLHDCGLTGAAKTLERALASQR